MKGQVLGGLGVDMATTGIFKATADVEVLWTDCCWHGNVGWNKPEEFRAPFVLA